ncbi:MAG: XcyI family restriction endonuclease [Thermomicrobia bacterium]|nr:XcyI family restriction endonuclease [Thermomicrobia bacterium]
MTKPGTSLYQALQRDYGLRSLFFSRKVYEWGFLGLMDELHTLIVLGNTFDWQKRDEWGITPIAWETIEESSLSSLHVFTHPLVLMQYPHMIAYYRNVAVLSQKGTKSLVADTVPFEQRRKSDLSHDLSLRLCLLFNTHISTIIEGTPSFTQRDVDALYFSSAGTQIDGSWRNRIGQESELAVRRLFIAYLFQRNLVATFVGAHNEPILPVEMDVVLENLSSYRAIQLTNGRAIRFSSEPDISLLDADGSTLAVIEIKGGKDTAGALERLGAVQKSFGNEQGMNAEVVMVLVASCVTEEMTRRMERLRSDGRITTYFDLTDILYDERKRSAFLEYVGSLLDL